MITRTKTWSLLLLFLVAVVWTGCNEEEEWIADGEVVNDETEEVAVADLPEEQEEFWSRLQAHCGEAFEGEVVEDVGGDGAFGDERLVMHVRQCRDHTTHVPFHVGDDHSRTWVFTRTAEGLRLKHDHRHEDGTEEGLTQYGGDTEDAGEAGRQEFPADQYTAELIPYAANNVWMVEIEPGEEFVYSLRREGEDRRFRARFDLSEPVDPPRAPWGYEDTEPTHGPDGEPY